MDEPRINVSGKAIRPTEKGKKSDTHHWAGRESFPSPRTRRKGRVADHWSPYLKPVRGRKRPLPRNRGTRRPGGINHSLLKLVVSGGSAILVGTLMGLLILKMFVGGEIPEDTSAIDTHLKDPVQSVDKEEEEIVTLPEVTPVWVQGGVFSDKEGAETFATAQRAAGQAAVIRRVGEQYRVFSGVGWTHDEASVIAAEIEDSGGDAYIKDDLPIAAVTLSNPMTSTQSENLHRIATEGENMTAKLGALSVASISEAASSSDLSGKITDIEQSHRAFVTALSEVKEALTDDEVQVVERMDQLLAQSIEAVKRYEREAAEGSLWQVQENLMHYLLAYEQLG